LRVNKAFLCQVCTADWLETVEAYAQLPRVTSDCRPWPIGGKMAVCHDCGAIQKLPDATWLEEIDTIYRGYNIYHLSDGAEQVIFDQAGDASPRSRKLIDLLKQAVSLPSKGKLIDIGCGNGSGFDVLASALPAWSLYGSDLSDMVLPLLKKLPNFVELFTSDLSGIEERFDIVTMIYSLEHMQQPARTLAQALQLLAPEGTLFVQVPDVETSPFDLVVADHLMHFTRETLRLLAERVGWSVKILRNDVLPEDITFVAQRGTSHARGLAPAEGIDIVRAHLNWLRSVIAAAKNAALERGPFGLFGTANYAMWLYGALEGRIDFFVDEDKMRIGRKVNGLPIVSPADIPAGATVYIPLLPQVAEGIIARLSPLGTRFIAPPALEY
jgi:SAM-dependent methyltransferase